MIYFERKREKYSLSTYLKMGCFWSREMIDFDFIQPSVLRIKGGLASYSGTTERGRCQVCSKSFDR